MTSKNELESGRPKAVLRIKSGFYSRLIATFMSKNDVKHEYNLCLLAVLLFFFPSFFSLNASHAPYVRLSHCSVPVDANAVSGSRSACSV